jgi:outer membrane protein assembly factor BamA
MLRFAFAAALVVTAARLDAQDIRTRPTGHSLTGLPAVNFDSDEGFGYGALLQYYDYGTGDAQPYRFSLQPTVFLTTRGRRDVVLFLDAPHLLPGGWRLGASVAREQQQATPYYGIGNSTVNDTMRTRGANPYFYRFGRTVLRGSADVQHTIGIPALRMLLGVGTRTVTVRPVPYDSGTSLLAQTFGSAATRPATDSRYARVGLVLDTRDREIGPHSGNWSELLVQRVQKVLGGSEEYTRITGSVRQYVPLGSSLTFAQRVVAQTVRGNPSVSDIFIVQSSFRDDEVLGGASSLRGIPKNRYAGKGVAFSNSELRWSAAQFRALGRPVGVVLSGFVDAGRVWTDGLDLATAGSDLHVGYGGGLHLAVGPTMVISADVGHSTQSTAAIYLGLGYLF